ncbi:thioredoxin family protein [Maribellus sp. YY47]|uniref:thioredoxin family protein n=1 Tax=Maribellus sp. YY47 TaxID=2929486 RepID=UPI0020015BDF|nr:thioredoxin family protein [Maribellus sp. YY47]MCK3685028.1 thioredoxin family protein [Maribellus sp. YY47]
MVRKHGFLVVMILLVGALLILLFNKEKLYDYISGEMQQQNSEQAKFEAKQFIESNYNYAENGKDLEFSLLQFKSSGCTICKQMEPVLEEIKNWNGAKVNIQVFQVLNPDSQEMMKYFGISTIPMHILLDKNGQEFSRNYGFISADDLKSRFLKNKQANN